MRWRSFKQRGDLRSVDEDGRREGGRVTWVYGVGSEFGGGGCLVGGNRKELDIYLSKRSFSFGSHVSDYR